MAGVVWDFSERNLRANLPLKCTEVSWRRSGKQRLNACEVLGAAWRSFIPAGLMFPRFLLGSVEVSWRI